MAVDTAFFWGSPSAVVPRFSGSASCPSLRVVRFAIRPLSSSSSVLFSRTVPSRSGHQTLAIDSTTPIVSVLAPPPSPRSTGTKADSNHNLGKVVPTSGQPSSRPTPGNPSSRPATGPVQKSQKQVQENGASRAREVNGAAAAPAPPPLFSTTGPLLNPSAKPGPVRGGEGAIGAGVPGAGVIRPPLQGVSLEPENGAAAEKAAPVNRKKSWKSVFRFWDSSLSDHERPLPLPMTYPDADPYPQEIVDQALSCNPEKEDCKTPVFTWTDECSKCQGSGTVSYYRRKGHEVICTCISCHGIGAVQRITTRPDTKRKKDIEQ